MTSNITYIWSQELPARGAGFTVYAPCAEIKVCISSTQLPEMGE